jgi:predicted metal-dependent enzyme (double-stranded beta helix superfamily)
MFDVVLPATVEDDQKTRLTQAELVALAREWAPRLGSGGGTGQPNQRWYVRLEHNDLYEVWLLGWNGTSNTEFHDHGGSAGAVAVVAGEVTEARLRHGGSVIRRSLKPGTTFSFGPHAIHDVQNSGNGSSLTVHVYSPPLTTQTYFEPDVDGVKPVRTVQVEGPEEGAVDLTDQR